jgi:hypothetical protein
MAANKNKKVYVPCKLAWAKLREVDRDTGKNLPDGDMKRKIEADQGHYLVNCLIDTDTKAAMIRDGIPSKGMQGMLFKTDADGNLFYKAKRPHYNSKLYDEHGNQGVIMGPPKIVVEDAEGNNRLWDWDEDGLLGNETEAVVKFDVWDGKIITLEAVKVTKHVEYIPEDKSQGEYF